MKPNYFNFTGACIMMLGLSCVASPDAAGGTGGMQGSNAPASNSQSAQAAAAPVSVAPVFASSVSSAQVTGARVGAGQTVNAGNPGAGRSFASVQQVPPGSAYPYARIPRNEGFGTESHAHSDGDPNHPGGPLLPPGAARDGRFQASNQPVLQPPVALDPAPQAAVSRSGASSESGRNPTAAAPAAFVPGQIRGSNAARPNAGIDTANHVLTKAAQWRHDPGHPHHHRHFVYLNNTIFLLDEGIYDSPPDFSSGPDASSYTYEDGYYDTFDASVVGSVQTRLGDEGYYNGVVDSKFKTDVRDAITKYQQDHGLPVTGVIDESLLKELGLL